MIDRAAYIGGFDGVSSLTGARTIGLTPVGTMPHGLIIVFGDQREAWKAFHQHIAPEVARIAIVDTIYDEKPEAIMACETLGQDLDGVRLDTPGSRRGSFEDIIKEVRWELDLRGYKNVKLFVSGSIDEHNIESLIEAGADGFGVGTSISNAPTVDFAMDIVEMDGESVAKRGKFGGKKRVYRCTECVDDIITPWDETAPECGQCGTTRTSILEKYIDHGKIIKELPSPEEIRKYVLRQLKKIKL
jgi:nicotinate phosphoribosyltransferase